MSAFVASAESPLFRSLVGLEWIHPPDGRLEQAVTLPAAMCEGDGRAAPGVLAILADSTLGTAAAAAKDGSEGIVTLGLHVDVIGELPGRNATLALRTDRVLVEGRHVWVNATLALGERPLGWVSWRGLFVEFADRHARVRGARKVPRADETGGAGVVRSVDDLLRLEMHGETSGEVRIVGRVPASFVSGWRTLHGGVVALVAERAARHATGRTADGVVRSLSLDAEFFRPVPNGQDVLAVGAVVHRGRSYVTAEGRVILEDGRLASIVRTTGALAAA